MKETFKNIKKVYRHGRKYKKSLYVQIFCCICVITFNIIIPILGAKQILYLTDGIYEELIAVSILVACIAIFNAFVRVS